MRGKIGRGIIDAAGVDLFPRFQVGVEASPVTCGNRRAFFWIGHDEKMIFPEITAVGRLDRKVDAFPDHIEVDGAPEIETFAHRPRRGQQMVYRSEVHRLVLV